MYVGEGLCCLDTVTVEKDYLVSNCSHICYDLFSNANAYTYISVVVVVCHDQVRLQVSQGFRCRDS